MRKICYFLTLACLGSTSVFALDCNHNSQDDSQDISSAASKDCNSNNIPDECDTRASGLSYGAVSEIDIKSLSVFGFVQDGGFLPTKIADFNGDNKPDLWGMYSLSGLSDYNQIFIYLNKGDNTFFEPIEFKYFGTTGFSTATISNALTQDVDSDGDLDILFRLDRDNWRNPTPSRSFQVIALVNNGSGTFVETVTDIDQILPVGAYLSSYPTKLIAASIATTASSDLVMINEGRLYALYNLGGLKYRAFDMGSSGLANKLSFIQNSTFNTPRIEVYSEKGMEGSLTGNGDGSLSRLSYAYANFGVSNIASYFDGSLGYSKVFGLLDRIQRESQGRNVESDNYSVLVALNTGIGNDGYYPSAVGNVQSLNVSEDVDNDGDKDVVVIGETSAEVLLNSGDGKYEQKVKMNIPSGYDRLLAFYDFNNDSKLDFLFKSTTAGKLGIAYSNSTFPLTSAVASDVNANFIPDLCEKATPGDFDGDKRGDRTVVRNYSGNLLWLIRQTTLGEYSSTLNVPLGNLGDTLLAGDYDGDQKLEPGVVSSLNGGLVWKSIKSDNSVSEVKFGLVGDTPLTGYFNSDIKLDRVVVRNYLGNLAWYINTDGINDSVATAKLFGLTGDTPFVGDIDGDGLSDLVVSRVLLNGQMVWYSLSLNGDAVSGPFSWGLNGDTAMPPVDLDGNGDSNYLVSRPIGGFLHTFGSSINSDSPGLYYAFVKLFGLPGDDLYHFYNLRLPFPQLAVRRKFTSNFYNDFYDSVSESAKNDSFGFSSDEVIGVDGKAVATKLNFGSFRCTTTLSAEDRAGYLWDPNLRGKPKYFIPDSLRSSVSAVSILSSNGSTLDTMKARSRNSKEYNSRTRSYSSLESVNPYGSLYLQVVLKDGRAICDKIFFPFLKY